MAAVCHAVHRAAEALGQLQAAFGGDDAVVIADDMVKVFAWYDNEWGYSTRLVDLAKIVATK